MSDEIKKLILDEAGINIGDSGAAAIGSLVANYPVTAVQVAKIFNEDELKQISEAVKVVKDDTASVEKRLRAYEMLGKLVSLLPVV